MSADAPLQPRAYPLIVTACPFCPHSVSACSVPSAEIAMIEHVRLSHPGAVAVHLNVRQ